MSLKEFDYISFYFSFDGRVTRQEFILGLVLPSIIIQIILGLIAEETGAKWLDVLAILLLVLPSWAVSVKRWHDRGKSGWWLLIVLIPVVGLIWSVVETYCLRGTVGPNKYGPDPLAN